MTATPARPAALVTGANRGIGYQTALGLAWAGYDLHLACRDVNAGEAARAAILQALAGPPPTGPWPAAPDRGPAPAVSVLPLDLGALASVRAAAARVPRLDLLVNNAGLYTPGPAQTADGFELQLGVNFLGHFLLTALLIDKLPDHPAARVVHLSSVAARRRVRLSPGEPQWTAPAPDGYPRSKLACLVFSDTLQRRLSRAGRRCRAVCAHPGASLTAVFRQTPAWVRLGLWAAKPLLLHPVEEAAQPVLRAALDPELEGGAYLGPTGPWELRGPPGPATRPPAAQDPALGARLWAAACEATGARWPELLALDLILVGGPAGGRGGGVSPRR